MSMLRRREAEAEDELDELVLVVTCDSLGVHRSEPLLPSVAEEPASPSSVGTVTDTITDTVTDSVLCESPCRASMTDDSECGVSPLVQIATLADNSFSLAAALSPQLSARRLGLEHVAPTEPTQQMQIHIRPPAHVSEKLEKSRVRQLQLDAASCRPRSPERPLLLAKPADCWQQSSHVGTVGPRRAPRVLQAVAVPQAGCRTPIAGWGGLLVGCRTPMMGAAQPVGCRTPAMGGRSACAPVGPARRMQVGRAPCHDRPVQPVSPAVIPHRSAPLFSPRLFARHPESPATSEELGQDCQMASASARAIPASAASSCSPSPHERAPPRATPRGGTIGHDRPHVWARQQGGQASPPLPDAPLAAWVAPSRLSEDSPRQSPGKILVDDLVLQGDGRQTPSFAPSPISSPNRKSAMDHHPWLHVGQMFAQEGPKDEVPSKFGRSHQNRAFTLGGA